MIIGALKKKLWLPSRKIWTPPGRTIVQPAASPLGRCPRCRRAARARFAPRWRRGVPAVAMANGDDLLDADGNEILDDDGNDQLSDDAGDECCCGPIVMRCFQQWAAYWDCVLLDWVLTPGAKVCLPSSTSTAWTGSGCTGYARYVPMEQDCATDGDCGGYANTAEPTPPFGGARPSDCYCPDCGISDCDLCNSFPGDAGATPYNFRGVLSGWTSHLCTDLSRNPASVVPPDINGVWIFTFAGVGIEGCSWTADTSSRFPFPEQLGMDLRRGDDGRWGLSIFYTPSEDGVFVFNGLSGVVPACFTSFVVPNNGDATSLQPACDDDYGGSMTFTPCPPTP